MWTLKLSLTTLWMAGNVAGWTFGGSLHLLALFAIALVLVEGTSFEPRLRGFARRLLPRMLRVRASRTPLAAH